MKEFFVGLIFLILVLVLAVTGVLLFPLLVVLGVVMRFVIMGLLAILAIWLLGKLIIVVWESLKSKKV